MKRKVRKVRELDQEWVELMKQAKSLGFSTQEVSNFLLGKKKRNTTSPKSFVLNKKLPVIYSLVITK